MMTEMISSDELSFLAQKNRELEIEALMTEELREVIQNVITEGASVFEKLVQSKVEGTELKGVNYQVTNAKAFLENRVNDSMMVFSYKGSNDNGKHIFFIDHKMFENMNEDETHEFMNQFEAEINEFYGTFGAALDVELQVKAVSMAHYSDFNESQFEINLDALHEVKTYEFKVEEEQFQMIHLSDMDFIEYAYDSNEEVEEESNPVIEEKEEEKKVEEEMEMKPQMETPVLSQDNEVKKPLFSPLEDVDAPNQNHNLDVLQDVPLEINVVLGKTKRSISEILDIGVGKIIELDKNADEPLEMYCNGKLIALGEVVVIEENFGIRITKFYQSELKGIR